MIHVVVSNDPILRAQGSDTHIKTLGVDDVLVIDDSTHTLADLETYSYPSLFDAPRAIVASFLIGSTKAKETGSSVKSADLPLDTLKKLAASPVPFVLREVALTAPQKKILERAGATIAITDGTPARAPQKNLFMDVAALCTTTNKKDRWLAYHAIIADERPEAIIGIMYWKLRDLVQKKGVVYKNFYDALITAHSQAWIQGTPLALAIEKVLLTN